MKLFSRIILFFLLLYFSNILSAQHFIEYQDSANIDHIFDHTGFLGGGAVFFDYDNDSDDDLYITAGNERDHFYENNGDGTFIYKSIGAGFLVTKLYYTTGVIAGDIDNDGFKDLFVTTWFSDFGPLGKNLLYKNNGDGTFTEIWNQQEEKDNTQAMGATFIDYDLDGLLDIYVASYVDETGFIHDDNNNIIGFDHTCYKNTLYHNIGNGEFEEKSFSLNIIDDGCALATTATDFDMDGDMDIYVANDFGEFVKPNQLYQYNAENGFYWGVGSEYNADESMYGMGIAVGDIDNDLDLDYYVTNFGKNAMLRNDGNVFTNISDPSGTGDEYITGDSLFAIGWGTAFLDVDNDTDLDLYIGNGFVPSPSFLPSYLFQNDKLFLNDGNASFEDVGLDFGIENKYATRGVSYSDYDNDGDLDILAVVENIPVTNLQWATLLYNNQYGNQKNWFQVTLEGVKVNRDAYGSKLYLYAGNKVWLQEISGGSSHASQPSSRAHFGLDDLTHIDSLNIVWTGGEHSQTLYDLGINQHIYVVEDTALINSTSNIFKPTLNISISPNPVNQFVDIEFDVLPLLKNGKMEIFNLYGKLKREIIIDSLSNKIQINTSHLNNGIYFISANMDGYIFTEKIIVNHG